VARGDGEEVDDFLTAIADSALAGHITSAHQEEIELPEAPRGFQIVP